MCPGACDRASCVAAFSHPGDVPPRAIDSTRPGRSCFRSRPTALVGFVFCLRRFAPGCWWRLSRLRVAAPTCRWLNVRLDYFSSRDRPSLTHTALTLVHPQFFRRHDPGRSTSASGFLASSQSAPARPFLLREPADPALTFAWLRPAWERRPFKRRGPMMLDHRRDPSAAGNANSLLRPHRFGRRDKGGACDDFRRSFRPDLPRAHTSG